MKGPNSDNLIEVPFTDTIPNVSWYRNQVWPTGTYKRFKHGHTMCSNTEGFTFYNEEAVVLAVERQKELLKKDLPS